MHERTAPISSRYTLKISSHPPWTCNTTPHPSTPVLCTPLADEVGGLSAEEASVRDACEVDHVLDQLSLGISVVCHRDGLGGREGGREGGEKLGKEDYWIRRLLKQL